VCAAAFIWVRNSRPSMRNDRKGKRHAHRPRSLGAQPRPGAMQRSLAQMMGRMGCSPGSRSKPRDASDTEIARVMVNPSRSWASSREVPNRNVVAATGGFAHANWRRIGREAGVTRRLLGAPRHSPPLAPAQSRSESDGHDIDFRSTDSPAVRAHTAAAPSMKPVGEVSQYQGSHTGPPNRRMSRASRLETSMENTPSVWSLLSSELSAFCDYCRPCRRSLYNC